MDELNATFDAPAAVTPQQERRPRTAILRSPEAEVSQTKLDLRLESLIEELHSTEVQKRFFTEPGGEQEVGNKIAALQLQELPKIYKDVVFDGSHLSTHETQREKYSCQLACVANALHTFGFTTTEEEIAQVVGKKGSTEGSVWSHEVIKFLQKTGANVSEMMSISSVIKALMEGAVVVLPLVPPTHPVSHAVLLSGVRINHGVIQFYTNDPHTDVVEILSLADVVRSVIPYSFKKIVPVYAISKE